MTITPETVEKVRLLATIGMHVDALIVFVGVGAGCICVAVKACIFVLKTPIDHQLRRTL